MRGGKNICANNFFDKILTQIKAFNKKRGAFIHYHFNHILTSFDFPYCEDHLRL